MPVLAADADDGTGAVAAFAAWLRAFNAQDVATIAALYAADASLWGTTAQTLLTTPDGIRAYFQQTFQAMPSLQITPASSRVRAFGDTATNAGGYILELVAGGERRSIAARFSFTYQRTGSDWLIVDHHSSLLPAGLPV